MKKIEYFKYVAIFIFLLLIAVVYTTGCSIPEREKDSVEQAAKANEESVKNLIANDTLPVISKSLARGNLKRRAEFINQPDRIGYLYLISENGQLIKEVQVLGIATSLNSYMTPMEELTIGETSHTRETYVAEAPDLDGTWGTRPEGIFWFTPDGVYQEWNGLYFYSSERMTFTTQPLLIEIGE